MKVRIKKISKKAYGGQQPDGALDVTPAAWGGADMKSAKEGTEVQQSLTSVPRSKANLEAEGGETAFGPISGDTIPDHYKIKGPRHTNGGVPLNLPDDTFIFSDTKAMKITDPKILTMFGKKAKKGGYTPADLAKPFDINKYKGILMDPDTDRKERETAELMIKNYIMKLGALALAQESKKGFPQGIPEMAKPYMEANGITEDQLLPQEAQEGGAAEQPMMRIGGSLEEYKDKGQVGSKVDDPLAGYSKWAETSNFSPEAQALREYNAYMNRTDDPNKQNLVSYKANSNDPIYQKILGKYQGSNTQNNPKTLGDVESYKNATGQQKALYESLTPEQRKMMVSTAGQQQKGQPARDVSGRIIQRDDYGGNYGQQRRYPNQRGNRFGFSDFNPFGQRAFTKDFEYLTPFNSPTFSGTNTPFTGQMPAGNNQLTSISQTYKKNPFFKSLFNKDMARKEFTTKYNFNGTGSSIPSLAGGDNAISNFKVPQLDFNQSTQSGTGSQGLAGNVSNRQFAKDFQGEGFGSRRDIRKALRKGDMTQQEYMDLMNQEGSPITTTGSGPIPKPDNSAIPSWITDPIGSIQSGTGSSPTSGVSRLPVQSAGQLDSPAFGIPAMRQTSNNPANPISSRNAFATGALQGVKDQLASFDKNQAAESNLYDDILKASPKEKAELMAIDGITEEDLRRYQQSGLDAAVLSRNERIGMNNNSSNVSSSPKPTTPTGNESSINLGSNLNQMRTNAGMYNVEKPNQSFPGLTNDAAFDFSTDRSTPYQFGQNLKKVKIRRPISSTTVNDGRSMNFNPDYSDSFAYGGYAENGIEVEDEGDDKRPAYNTLYPASETQAMNPNAGAGKDYDIYDPYFSKAYYGDEDIDRPELEEISEEYVEDKAYVPRRIPVPKAKAKPKSTQTDTKNQSAYAKMMEGFPLHVFDLSPSTLEMPTQEEEDFYSKGVEKRGVMWGPLRDKYNERNLFLAHAAKNLEPRKQQIYDWANKKFASIEHYIVDPADGRKMINPEWMALEDERNTMIDKLEETYNKQYSFQDYEIDLTSRPSGELTGPYKGQTGPSPYIPDYDLTEEGKALRRRSKEFQNIKAFGGENPILDMFVYGGADEYPHGGTFHMPEKDFTSLSAPELGKLPGTQTADDPIVNPITGESSAAVYNSETGGYDETNPEYAEGNNPFSIETTQKVNSAFTFRPDVFMGQLGAGARAVGNAADAVNQGLNTVDAQDLARMQNSKERVRRGSDYSNEQGVTAINAISPTSNMSYMTKYGGTPMAMYGTTMGGAYYPAMRNGGTRKVRILPKADLGAVVAYTADGTPMTQEQLNAYRKKNPNATITPTKKSKKELTDEGYIDMGDGTFGRGDISGEGSADREFNVPTNITNTNVDVCAEIKKGRGGKSFTRGEALAVGMVNQSTADKYADCYRVEESGAEKADFVKVEAEEVIDKKTGKKECKCFKLDEQGNQTEEVISETIVNADEECPVCEATVEAMRGADPKDPGGFSDMELEGIRSSQKMRYRLPRIQSRYQQNQEAIATLVSPRVADIKSKGAQNVRAMQAAGLKPNQIVAALMGPGMEKSLAEQGRRYNIADTTNSKILTDSAFRNLQSQAATDRSNAMTFGKDSAANANFAAKENQLRNVRGATTLSAKQLADKGRRDRASLNFELEDFQLDRNYNPYKRYNPKDPNPTKPEKDLLAQYMYNKEKLGADDADNALRIAQQQLKKQSVKYGGFIPRYNTMPYGN